MYQNLCHTSGFGSLQTYGTIRESIRDDLEGHIFGTIETRWDEFSQVMHQWHRDVSPNNLQPFIGRCEPNVISFLHLVAQSINDEWVFSVDLVNVANS